MSILQGHVTDAFTKYQAYLNHGTFKHSYSFHKCRIAVNLSDSKNYTRDDFNHDVMNAVYGYAAMSVGYFFAGAIQVDLHRIPIEVPDFQVTSFLIICENINNRMRREFVRCILKQDISWFDKNNSGTLAIKLFDDLERVKEGTGDKFGMIFQLSSQFLTGTVIW